MATKGQPPWHLWGNTQTFVVPAFTIPAGSDHVVTSAVLQGQMARVPYLRPDTFHWLFSATLEQAGDLSGVIDATAELDVHFDLTAGVGRSSIIIPDFDKHTFTWASADPVAPVTPLQTRTTSVVGKRNWVNGTGFDSTLIDEITAQDIQLQVRVDVVLGLNQADFDQLMGQSAVTVSAHFAPKHHARPEWLQQVGRFPGGEDQTL